MTYASGKRGARIGSKESKSPISLSFTATPQFDFICTGAFGFGFLVNFSFSMDAIGPAHTRPNQSQRRDSLNSRALKKFRDKPSLAAGIRSPRQQVLASKP